MYHVRLRKSAICDVTMVGSRSPLGGIDPTVYQETKMRREAANRGLNTLHSGKMNHKSPS